MNKTTGGDFNEYLTNECGIGELGNRVIRGV